MPSSHSHIHCSVLIVLYCLIRRLYGTILQFLLYLARLKTAKSRPVGAVREPPLLAVNGERDIEVI